MRTCQSYISPISGHSTSMWESRWSILRISRKSTGELPRLLTIEHRLLRRAMLCSFYCMFREEQRELIECIAHVCQDLFGPPKDKETRGDCRRKRQHSQELEVVYPKEIL